MISKKNIEKLNMCKHRFYNYKRHYGDREFTHRQFMGLKNLHHSDKVWVAFKLMPKENISSAVADIAESVLPICESKYPNDLRPRKAVEAIRLYAKGEITKEMLLTASTHAENAASEYSIIYSASASAAVYASYSVAASSINAATYAATCAVFAHVDPSHSETKSKRAAQEKLVRKILLKYWKEDAK